MKSLKIGKVKYDIMLKAAMVLVLLGLWLPYLAEARHIEGHDGLIPCQGGTEVVPNPNGDGNVIRIKSDNPACTLQDFLIMIVGIINLAIELSGIVAIIMIIWHGGGLILAGIAGKSEIYEASKKGVTFAVLGLLIVIFAYVIINGLWAVFFPAGSDPSINYGSTWMSPWNLR